MYKNFLFKKNKFKFKKVQFSQNENLNLIISFFKN
jgi:hypothetical protein